TLSNTGTAPATVELGELPGPFEILDSRRPGVRGGTWSAPAGLIRNPAYDPDSATTEGQYLAGTLPEPAPSAAGDIITSWPPGELGLAWGVGFDGDVWLSDVLHLANHAFTVDGATTDVNHPAAWAGDWPADMALLGDGEMCQVGVGNTGIYCWDTG